MDLEKRSALLLGKHSNYLERETAVDMKMHEKQGRLEETSELQQQVEGEKSRLLAVLVLREDADDRALLEEFDAHGVKLAEKRAELQAQQKEDLDKKTLLAQKRILVEEHLAAIGEEQEKNKAALKGLGGPPLPPRPEDPRAAASKKLLSQLQAVEKQDAEVSAFRKAQAKEKMEKKNKRGEEKQAAEMQQQHHQQRMHEMEQAEQQRQQQLQDQMRQEQQQSQAQQDAIAERQQQQEMLAERTAMALAEEQKAYALRQEQVRQEEQKQEEVQAYLRARMVREEQRQQDLMLKHQQEEEQLRLEIAAEQQQALRELEQQHQQRLQLLEQRTKEQRAELYQEAQQTQFALQHKLEAANNLETLPALDLSEDEPATPVAKRPKPYSGGLRGVSGGSPNYKPPTSKAPTQIPFAASSLPQAKAPGPSNPNLPAAFAIS